jgi:hypothetical protein
MWPHITCRLLAINSSTVILICDAYTGGRRQEGESYGQD